MRIMGYDYVAYKLQYDNNAKKYSLPGADKMEEDEYLSKMKKTDKFIPVITVLMYYGEKPWDGAANCTIDYRSLDREGESGMWTVFEETKKEGVEEGKAQAIVEISLESGFSEQQIIEKLQQKLNISMSTAQEYFNLYGKIMA